ncbi:MAG: TRAP transporter substrate-binding protein [Dehalococcoidia bacterium]
MSAEQVVIHAAGYQVPASVHNRAMRVIEAELAARVGDRVRFEFTDSVLDLGKTAGDLFKMVESGELTLCYQSTTRLAQRIPEFGMLDLPFVFRERQDAYAVLEGPFGDFLRDRIESTSVFRILGWWDNGYRHLTNRARTIRTPEDCAGLTIRTQFSETAQQAFRLMGFEPVAIDIRDLPAALEAGTVDAQDNALTNIYNFEIYRKHPYITLSGHAFGTSVVLANADRLAALDEDVREALTDAVRIATETQHGFAAAEDATIIERLAGTDAEVTTLTAGQHEAFVDAVSPLIDADRERFGADLFAQATGR